MPRRSPEEELASFVATLPKFLRSYLGELREGESFTDADTQEWLASDSARNLELTKRYEELLHRCPPKYKKYREKRLRDQGLAPLPKGAPRKDAEAAEAAALKASGKTWQHVARVQGKSRDAARNLVALRRKKQEK